jgi:hypothetical protein
MINNIIIKTANKYVGQKELPNNSGFEDEKVQELMELVG